MDGGSNVLEASSEGNRINSVSEFRQFLLKFPVKLVSVIR